MGAIRVRLSSYAEYHTGLFMWTIVLPLLLGVVAVLHYAFGLNLSSLGS
jgi:hypothetical protein